MAEHLEKDTSIELMYKYGQEMLINGASIWHEIEDARTQLDDKNYKQFGRNVGEIMNLIFTAQDEEGYVPLRSIILDISKGILSGALDAKGLDSIDQCMDGGFIIFYNFKSAVDEISKQTVVSVKNGI